MGVGRCGCSLLHTSKFCLGMTLAPLSPDFHADGGGCGLEGDEAPMDESQDAFTGDTTGETQAPHLTSEVSSDPIGSNFTNQDPAEGISNQNIGSSDALLQNEMSEKTEVPEETESKPMDSALETDFFSSGFPFEEPGSDEKDSIKPSNPDEFLQAAPKIDDDGLQEATHSNAKMEPEVDTKTETTDVDSATLGNITSNQGLDSEFKDEVGDAATSGYASMQPGTMNLENAPQLKDECESKSFLELGGTPLSDAGFQQNQIIDPLVSDMHGPSNVDQFLSTDQLPSQSPPKGSSISIPAPQGVQMNSMDPPVSNDEPLDPQGAAVLAEFQHSMVQYAKSMDDSEAADALANMANVHVDRSAVSGAATTQSSHMNNEEVLLREALEMFQTPISQQSPFVSYIDTCQFYVMAIPIIAFLI